MELQEIELAKRLIVQQLELIEKKILVQVIHENGYWCYALYQLPSDNDIAFAESGECQDGELWKNSDLLNSEWFLQEQKSFLEALANGIKDADNFLKLK
jgi:hypothetical protein